MKEKLPRKIKKAFKQLKLAPRITNHGWFQTIQFGIHTVQGRKTKHTYKAERILKRSEMQKCSEYLVSGLKQFLEVSNNVGSKRF